MAIHDKTRRDAVLPEMRPWFDRYVEALPCSINGHPRNCGVNGHAPYVETVREPDRIAKQLKMADRFQPWKPKRREA